MMFLPQSRLVRKRIFYIVITLVLGPLAVIWIIAFSDQLFLKTVPIEQRLVSHNEVIRKKAQQELLGLRPEAKQSLTDRLTPELSQGDGFARKWAAISLALIGPQAQGAIPALLVGVSAKEKDVSQACRVALSEIGAPDPTQLPALMEALHSPREAIRCEAATSVAKLGPAAQSAIPLLVQETADSAELPECAGAALASLIRQSPESLPALTTLLASNQAEARRNAAFVLSQIDEKQPETLATLLNLLANDSDGSVRLMAARALTLREAPDRGAIPSFLYALRKARSEAVREMALDLLIKANPDSEVMAPALLAALRDSDVQIRRQAIVTMRRMRLRRSEAYPALGHAQKDDDAIVRCLAAEQLVEMGAADRVAVYLLVRDLTSDAEDFPCAQDALAIAGHFNPDVAPALIKVLQGTDPEARQKAAVVLMQLGSRARRAIPALLQARKDGIPSADNAIKAIRESLPRPRS